MNAPHPPPVATTLSRAFVHAGLARFARFSLSGPSAVFLRLEESGDLSALLGTPAGDWFSACSALAGMAPDLPGPLGRLLADFRLQLHEWFVLALCGEVETSHLVGLALAELQAPGGSRPTLHLAAALCAQLFEAPFQPLGLPNHPLVRAGILEMPGDGPLPQRELAIQPELWALLCGDGTAWRGTCQLEPAGEMLPSGLVERMPALAGLIQGSARCVVFRGTRQAGLLAAAQLAATAGRPALLVESDAWQDQPALAAACRYAGWLPVMALDLGPGERHTLPAAPILPVPMVLVAGQEGSVNGEGVVEVQVAALSADEREAAWQAAFGHGGEARELAARAMLDGPTIRRLADRMRLDAQSRGEVPGPAHLRQARALHGTERLRLLAQPVARQVDAEALVLPAEQQAQFDALVERCRNRERLWLGLGASLAEMSPGVRALFAGDSGAGKTLAASRLATVLGAPLFRVDLAAVMNKYIGESEKNLGKVLDEAAELDAILLMDEADALFGKRGEGKETGERYANMLTNFLLTRIEQHPGIVVLTSNARGRIDSAFTRRFDAIIEFPLPGVEERLRLWRSHLGARSPGEEFCRLLASYCDLPGGHIRNAVLQAAAMWPAGPHALPPALLVAALAAEYRKLGRTPPPQLALLGG